MARRIPKTLSGLFGLVISRSWLVTGIIFEVRALVVAVLQGDNILVFLRNVSRVAVVGVVCLFSFPFVFICFVSAFCIL